MMNKETSIDVAEMAKFNALSTQWWDVEGPLKTLHDINPIRIKFIQSRVKLEGRRVLDVGCGGGILSECMAILGAYVTGIDAEQDAILTARAHAKENKLVIEYMNEAIETFDDQPFDVITCMEMLEHVSQPDVIIKHAYRLLKPGGMLILSTINRSPTAFMGAILAAEYLMEVVPRQTHEYKKFIKPSELAGALRRCGFELEALTGMMYNPLKRVASLSHSVSINYFMAALKPQKKTSDY